MEERLRAKWVGGFKCELPFKVGECRNIYWLLLSLVKSVVEIQFQPQLGKMEKEKEKKEREGKEFQ